MPGTAARLLIKRGDERCLILISLRSADSAVPDMVLGYEVLRIRSQFIPSADADLPDPQVR